jgi:hypothetical protein
MHVSRLKVCQPMDIFGDTPDGVCFPATQSAFKENLRNGQYGFDMSSRPRSEVDRNRAAANLNAFLHASQPIAAQAIAAFKGFTGVEPAPVVFHIEF